MDEDRTSVEFKGEIDDDGKIAVPASILSRLKKGSIHVRLSGNRVASELKARGVTEEEIQRIAATQLESRDQVVKFLLSEGALKRRSSFGSRSRRIRGGRQ